MKHIIKKVFLIFTFLLVTIPCYSYNLLDPNNDRIPFWDDSENDLVWLSLDSDTFVFNGTTLELDSDLTSLAAISYSANMLSFFAAADYAAMKTLLGLVIGTNVQAYSSELDALALLTSTAYGRALLEVANEAAFKALVNLEIGTDVQAYDADTAKTDVDETITGIWALGNPTAQSLTISSSDYTGTHTGADHGTILTDSAASWVVDALIGLSACNITDSSGACESNGIITGNTATTATATLSGGTDSSWDQSDSYKIGVHGGLEWDYAPDIDLRCNGHTELMRVDASAGFGGLLSHSVDFYWDMADADSENSPAFVMHCDPYGNVGTAPTIVMYRGFARDDSWNWNVTNNAGLIYLGTDGLPTQSAPAGAADIVQIIGFAESADVMYFNPQLTFTLLE